MMRRNIIGQVKCNSYAQRILQLKIFIGIQKDPTKNFQKKNTCFLNDIPSFINSFEKYRLVNTNSLPPKIMNHKANVRMFLLSIVFQMNWPFS